MPKYAPERFVLITAVAVVAALTAGGFWLSYAHLAEVAGAHGLGGSPARRWVWPATLYACVVAGELLMLRAGLRRVTDGWAIALTAIGSVGSIALSVVGVSGAGHASSVPLLDQIVAAVPPTAALLAFGVFMRQIHQLGDRTADRREPILDRPSEPPAASCTCPGDLPAAASQTARASDSGARPRAVNQAPTAREREPEDSHTHSGDPHRSSEPAPEPKQVSTPRRAEQPPNASIDELLAIARLVVARIGDVEDTEIAREIREVRGLKVADDQLQKVIELVEDEQDALWDAVDEIG
ncbi:DUF2637 domain-containing protein [Streptomyces roseochromogenus]|uniref:DUF2637 domain-containing protein n=1 Tax=Streptomyces roseochromogenus subsp. oscitans DS 12.976 TaxID=1352936 RepID=V6KAP6_STRRC|nr:DUF2637 domain-containing protein [Streptomyces roseochromogenus]EST29215.1 hypothetical protein M878_20810 [Streptomyces roseochromogenus subsp. oscitans DS 12.976]